MDTPTSISEMQKFHFGSKIICSDGEEGTLVQVGFDPTTSHITHIGIRQGRFFGKNVYLSYDTVTNATGEGVTLRITGTDVLTANKNAPTGVIFLDNKSVVEASGQGPNAIGKGSLLIVAVHPGSGALSYVVAHHLRPAQDTLLYQEYVTNLETDRVVVTIPEATLQSLPAYRSDNDLQQDVERILFDLTPLHVDFKGMTVRVLDSILYLNGNISSSLRADVVQDQALGVQGLLEIKNQLLGDDTLAADLAAALGRDERTRDLPIGVYPKLGVVRLSGAVHTPQQKAATEEIASNFPGVRGVINTLLVDAKAELIHVMSPAEGGEADDLIPGKYIRHTK
ncbi:MAG: hypothetical protein NVS4B11_08700 [Ktedonobacteraceae bacterium]